MINVRELKEQDILLLVNYWTTSSTEYLVGIGVDVDKLPTINQLKAVLLSQLSTPIKEKKAYALIWEYDNVPIGHSNVNPLVYGESANMHLHLWHTKDRKKGLGTQLVKKSLPFYFNNLELKTLYSEPYALNPAPHKTLEKVGFKFEKEYLTTPGSINFKQWVKQWRLTASDYKQLTTHL